eukprot:CAMPEP_0206017660 /NCGR_PEP_ID=MMETSP1464-20131121/25517_1 /ASSEMBLY_ACC=CAM_ASM_001124 /TAXON_ID=119497 /ORGANISM="Exanthemachrysis gayraliae, Strain RCC1523" /LENGTH=159 /DNA_ID=CAMNT_0053391507 /DNA_START=249 /DNA_END=725 /DNA_ORIENTATION=-
MINPAGTGPRPLPLRRPSRPPGPHEALIRALEGAPEGCLVPRKERHPSAEARVRDEGHVRGEEEGLPAAQRAGLPAQEGAEVGPGDPVLGARHERRPHGGVLQAGHCEAAQAGLGHALEGRVAPEAVGAREGHELVLGEAQAGKVAPEAHGAEARLGQR